MNERARVPSDGHSAGGRRYVVLGALLGIYTAVFVAFQIPAVLDPHVSMNGMVNWYGSPHGGAADDSVAYSAFQRGELRDTAPGFALLLGAMRLTGEQVLLGKLYPLILLAVTVLLLYQLVARLEGPTAAFFAGVLFLHMPPVYFALAGIPDTFAWPLLVTYLFVEQRGRGRAAVGVVAAAVAFYPPMALNCAALFVLRRIRRDPADGRLTFPVRDRRVWAVGGVMVAMVLLVVPWGAILGSGDSPELAAYSVKLARDAALNRGGILPPVDAHLETFALPYGASFPLLAAVRHWGWELLEPVLLPFAAWGMTLVPAFSGTWAFQGAIPALALALLAGVAWLGLARARPPRVVWQLLTVSLTMYALAVVAAPRLFLPQRYIWFTLSLAAVLAVAIVAARCVRRLPAWARTIAPPVLAACYLITHGTGIPRPFHLTDDYRRASGLLTYLGEVEGAPRVAGPPYLMDAVELFSQRETLLYCQELVSIVHILGGDDYNLVSWRLSDLHDAYYATEEAEVLAFMERQEVDLLVVQTDHFEDWFEGEIEPPCTFLPVEEDGVSPLTGPFVLADPPSEIRVYGDERGYVVISREALADHLGAGTVVPVLGAPSAADVSPTATEE